MQQKKQQDANITIDVTQNWTVKYGPIMLKINYDSLVDCDKEFLNSLYSDIKNVFTDKQQEIDYG